MAGAVDAAAAGAAWCGTTSVQDRPPAVAGPAIGVRYAYPSDGVDRAATVASRIAADVDEIDAWWRGQDPLRAPRFDRVAFPCGLQADIVSLRLAEVSDTLEAGILGARQIATLGEASTGEPSYEKYLVYYDGPADDDGRCGEATGRQGGAGVAIVYLGACADVSSAVVAAHELLHMLGALAEGGPPHACPDTRSHPCDSKRDVLNPLLTPNVPLGSLVLDQGRDDYYGHSGSWPDVQTSPWLRLVGPQIWLSVAIAGRGSVASDVPGVDCAATCATDWDPRSMVALEAFPARGHRFVRWSGACDGAEPCEVTLDAPKSVTALFAPERFRLVVAVLGRGTVTGHGTPCAAPGCTRSPRSYTPLRLHARPAEGWRLAGWTGACTGRSLGCTVSMKKPTTVRARFARR